MDLSYTFNRRPNLSRQDIKKAIQYFEALQVIKRLAWMEGRATLREYRAAGNTLAAYRVELANMNRLKIRE